MVVGTVCLPGTHGKSGKQCIDQNIGNSNKLNPQRNKGGKEPQEREPSGEVLSHR